MKIIYIFVVLALSACGTTPKVQDTQVKSNVAALEDSVEAVQGGENTDERLVDNGITLLNRGRSKQAIEECFDPVIARCDAQYNNSKARVYASRTSQEALYYLVLASAVTNESASAVSPVCADALYFKGYASLDLGRIDEAMELVKRAVDWSPVNAMYLGELGHLYQVKGDLVNALETFREAESSALTFSPDSQKNRELGRAKRGVGFILIEMGKLDEAEQKLKECLEIDKNDATALNELEYIKQLRTQSEKL